MYLKEKFFHASNCCCIANADHLKLDMVASLELLRNWSSVEVPPRASGIETRFVITAGGLTLQPSIK